MNAKQNQYYQKMVNFLKDYSKNTGIVINEQNCRAKLATLVEPPSLRNRIFYLILNVKQQKITWSKYVHQTLGFQDAALDNSVETPITFRDFVVSIKPNYLPMYHAFGVCAYEVAERHPQIRQLLQEIDPSWIVQVPLKMKDGKYYWTTQVGMPFELDQHNNIVSHLTAYEIGMEYIDQRMLKPMVIVKGGKERRGDLEKMLQQQLAEDFFAEFLGFNPKVVQLIKVYNEESDVNISKAAEQLNMSPETIKDYNKLIKKSINQHFSEEVNRFPTALSAARYLGRLLGDYLVLKSTSP